MPQDMEKTFQSLERGAARGRVKLHELRSADGGPLDRETSGNIGRKACGEHFVPSSFQSKMFELVRKGCAIVFS